jgi:prephenate dehydratase
MKYAYLGPEATFTEAALRLLPNAEGLTAQPFPTVPTALRAVQSGECVGAVVPLENSVSGAVPATLGELAAGEGNLRIDAEVALPVTFALMAKPGTALADVQKVVSHPHAHNQCHRWVSEHLPHAEVVTTSSTAAAARDVAHRTAAIAAPIAAERYGLSVLAWDIGERSDAVTRFISVRQGGPSPARTGSDRTSLVVTSHGESPGVLVDILAEFSTREVNLSWIQSWPTGDRLGRYRFFLEFDRHIEDVEVAEAVAALHGKAAAVTFLGSYPRAVRQLATSGKAVA